MATSVTVFNATRMQAIEDGSIVDGEINGSGHLILTKHNGDTIDAGDALVAVPNASTTVTGVAELATDAETIAGTDTQRVVTPSSLQAKVSSTTAKGIVELATSAETITGTDTTRAVTPAGLAADLATLTLDSLSDTAVTSPATGHVLQHDGSGWVNKAAIDLVSATAATDALTSKVTGDTQKRLIVNADGLFEWSSGSAVKDTNLYRSAPGILKTDNDFVAQYGYKTPWYKKVALASAAADITVSSIPSDIEVLKLRYRFKSTQASAATSLDMVIDSDTTTYNTAYSETRNDTTGVNVVAGSTSFLRCGYCSGSSANAGEWAIGEITICGWNTSAFATVMWTGWLWVSGTNWWIGQGGGIFDGAMPYDTILLRPALGNFATGSTLWMEGSRSE